MHSRRPKTFCSDGPVLRQVADIENIFLWALAHLDFLIGVNVDVKDYIRFHATDSDGDGYIKRFHAAYRDQAGDCTDSAAGDKRSAFLINHHEPPLKSTEALIAGIKLFFQSKAEAETSTKSSAPRVPGVVKAQLTKFEQYSEAETQVHTYELNGGPACVRFSEREQRKATDTKSTDIEVVDLDAPKGSEFRRRNVRIDWR